MTTFKIRPDEDYIQLNDLLKVLNWVNSGGQAKQVILQEQVTVNGQPEIRVRCKLKVGDTVSFMDQSVKIESGK